MVMVSLQRMNVGQCIVLTSTVACWSVCVCVCAAGAQGKAQSEETVKHIKA